MSANVFFTYSVLYRDRIDPFVFKFQFKNVEYSSGRNKTLLCYLVDKGNTSDGLLRGYLEDEHAGTHAEEAFFTQCLPHCNPALKYTVTWYNVCLKYRVVLRMWQFVYFLFQSGQKSPFQIHSSLLLSHSSFTLQGQTHTYNNDRGG